MITIRLPHPPSLNHYYRRVGPRTLISRGGREYRKLVVATIRGMHLPSLTGRLRVVIWLYPPDRRRRDLDNFQKCLLDSLQHAGVYADDSQIDALEISRCAVIPGGATTVHIHEWQS